MLEVRKWELRNREESRWGNLFRRPPSLFSSSQRSSLFVWRKKLSPPYKGEKSFFPLIKGEDTSRPYVELLQRWCKSYRT